MPFDGPSNVKLPRSKLFYGVADPNHTGLDNLRIDTAQLKLSSHR
jgi:hypothetical protein